MLCLEESLLINSEFICVMKQYIELILLEFLDYDHFKCIIKINSELNDSGT